MGKLITFWSPYRGQAGVTSAVCAIAGAFGLEYPELELALSHAQTDSMELEKRMDGRPGRPGGKELFEKTGVAALKLNYRQEVLTSEKIRRCAVPLRMKSLYLFPGDSRQGERDVLWYELMSRKLVQEFPITILDLECGWSETSLQLMQEADVAVVVLPQNPEYWQRFMEFEAEKLKGKKTGLVLGGCLENSRYSPGYFARKYCARMFGAIPRNAGFLDAMTEGRTLDFFMRNKLVGKKEENYEFIIQTQRTAECIKKAAEGK
ncbi:MAG: hypothetical protein J6J42_14040 [Lachnospiraceae bacterium]|nr:hypothetical protein [Lachnospiraceae bacterium]